MGFLALSLGAALSAIFYLKYWIFVYSSQTASAFSFRAVTRDGKTPAQKTLLRVVHGSLAVTAVQGGLSSAAGTQGRRSWTQENKFKW